MTLKVRHKNRPSEPWGQQGQFGEITLANGRPRITPAGRGIPAQAHVHWVEENGPGFVTWERLSDLTVMKTPKKQS